MTQLLCGCGSELKDHNKYFFRCPNCALLKIGMKMEKAHFNISLNSKVSLQLSVILFVGLTVGPTLSYATNEGSYQYGFWQGSLTGPQIAPGANWNPDYGKLNTTCGLSPSSILSNGMVMPAVTNTTACEDGFYNGYKNWCINHAVDCVENITIGDFSPIILQAHEQYLAGARAANGSGNLCPIGENAAFCTGWYNNNGEDHECGESSYSGPFSFHTLIGCPLDTINSNQMAKPHALIGTWDYVNGRISGKIVYSDYGNFTLTVPTKNAFEDYTLGGSWGSLGPNIVAQCYGVGACEINTLTTITPNHIEFLDNRGDIIHLMRDVGGH